MLSFLQMYCKQLVDIEASPNPKSATKERVYLLKFFAKFHFSNYIFTRYILVLIFLKGTTSINYLLTICSERILSLPPENIRKPYGFQMFSGARERVHWKRMGNDDVNSRKNHLSLPFLSHFSLSCRQKILEKFFRKSMKHYSLKIFFFSQNC